MKLRHLKLENFFSFGMEASVDFTNYNNLVLVKGELEESDNSNGAGKSSLFEAVFWSLTGKTVRGVRAGDVVRIGQKVVWVSVEFEHRDKVVKVTRLWSESRKEITLSIDGKEERFHDSKQGTVRIFEVLEVTPEILSLIGFYGRKFNTFSDLTPKERAEVVDLLAQGQKWEKGREVATQQSKQLSLEYDTASATVTNLNEQYASVNAEVASFENQLKELNESIAVLQKEAEGKLVTATAGVVNATAALITDEAVEQAGASTETEIATLTHNNEEAEKAIRAEFVSDEAVINEEISKTGVMITQVRDEITKVSVSLATARKSASDKRSQKGATECRTCGQKLLTAPDNDAIEAEAVVLDTAANDIQVKLDGLNNDLKELEELLAGDQSKRSILASSVHDKISAAHSANLQKITDLRNQHHEYKQSAANSKLILERAVREEDAAKAEIERIKNNTDRARLETAVSHKKEESARIQKEGAALEDKLEDLNTRANLAKYWANGFKDLRFSAFENTIATLTELMNSFCQQQGLDFESIEITSWKNTTEGKTLPEINIYVIRNGSRMGLDALSEGETQRVDLACFFTFSLLIERSIGFPVDFNVLDEPLSGLDYAGRQNVFNIINELSADRQIFIIDHDANFQDMFPDVLVIRKEGGVSKIT